MTHRISEFYNGKSVFMTGASGFLGAVLLEILLRCFPGIVRVYVLLRAKKGVDPHDRKECIFEKRIFESLLKNSPDIKDKVSVVAGDIALPNLGISEEDLKTLSEEVSIVFHLAALINFNKPVRLSAKYNSKGTDSIIKFCQNLRKCDALIHTSTAYANCHCVPNQIEEKIYKLPHSAQRYLDEIEHGSDESFTQLVTDCEYKWPNSYTFSKCLAENIINEKANDLPVAVVRPSIVFSCWKGSLPGFIEDGTGIASLSIGVGKGFVKVVKCDPDCIFDLIPCDIVANVHVIAAWHVGTKRRTSPFVVNCASGEVLKLKFSQYINVMYELSSNYPLPRSFQEQSVRLVKSKTSYVLHTLYDHYLPAFVLDIYLRFHGSKLRLVKLYKFYDTVMKSLCYFISTTFKFETDNFRNISDQLLPEEKEMFYTEMEGVTLHDMAKNLPFGSDVFDWKSDKLPQNKRREIVFRRTMIVTSIKRITVILIVYLFYLIISKIFIS